VSWRGNVITSQLFKKAKLEERVFMMAKFVQLGEELRLLNNYQYELWVFDCVFVVCC
jgi:hypothetical protein